MIYAQVMDDRIVNVVVWDGDSALELDGEFVQLAERAPLGIGWTRVDGVWVAPPEPEEEPEPEQEPEVPLDPEEWIVS